MITTLRQDAKGWWVDVTDNEDGKVDIIVGPTEDKQLALRWERHILQSYIFWHHMIHTQSITLFDTCMRRLRHATALANAMWHDAWMAGHQLPNVEREPLKLGNKMMTIDMDKRHE